MDSNSRKTIILIALALIFFVCAVLAGKFSNASVIATAACLIAGWVGRGIWNKLE